MGPMPSADDSLRCSTGSAARDEPVAGSAPTARYWVVIEHPGPWAKKPLDTAPFDEGLGDRLDAALSDHDAKVLLIRRTGRHPEDQQKLWRIVDTLIGDSVSGCWQEVADLDALPDTLAALATREASAEEAPERGLGTIPKLDFNLEPAPPMILVCTHGVRDVCCAIKGRPVAGLLSQAFGDEVWECTHLGGHRFAGTALVLPDGACYGRMAQADAVRVLTQHRVGRIDASHLRGVTRLSPAAQAAQVWGLAARERLSPNTSRGIDDIVVTAATPLDDHRTSVDLRGLCDATVSVEVVRQELPPAPVSCGKGPEAATAYRVVTPAPV